MDLIEAKRERERMKRMLRAPPGAPDAPAGSDRATGVDDPTPRAEYRDDPPEHPDTEPQSGPSDDEIKQAIRDLVAIERDRCLGYHEDELHMRPRDAIVQALGILDSLGDDPDEIVWPEYQEKLGIEVE